MTKRTHASSVIAKFTLTFALSSSKAFQNSLVSVVYMSLEMASRVSAFNFKVMVTDVHKRISGDFIRGQEGSSFSNENSG